MKILITEPQDYSEKALAIYRSLGEVRFGSTPLSDADILVVGLRHQIDKSWMDKMPNLTVIVSPTTGLNHLDVVTAKKRGIKLVTLRGRTSFLKKIPSTAEETIGLILALARNFPWSFDDVKKGNWSRMDWRGHQLMNKTIGLIGFGRLGKIVARYARAFRMRILACDPYVSAKTMKALGAESVSMGALLKKSDIVSLHVLLTGDTQNLIDENQLKLMKPTAYFINTARAELIRKGALEKALREKWIAGAAVDVMWDEEGSGAHLKKSALLAHAKKNKNLIIVPHIGGATFEAMQITQEFVAELVQRYVKGLRRSPSNAR